MKNKDHRKIGKELNSINDRIEYVRRSFGYPISTFARKIGSSLAAIDNVLSPSKNADPNLKMINNICRVFPVSQQWILLGIGKPFTLDDLTPFMYASTETGDHNAVDEEVNSRVKLIREENGLSQAMFANMIGVSRDVISFIENNRQTITVPAIKKLCKKFNITADWLLFGGATKKVRQ